MSTELGSQTEIEADCLGMADVKISVGLGREAGLDASAIFIGFEIVQNNVAYEVRRAGFGQARWRRPVWG